VRRERRAARLVQIAIRHYVISYAQMTPDEAAPTIRPSSCSTPTNSIRETLAGDRTTPIRILSESI